MGLQSELIDVFKANISEFIDQICLDDVLLHLGSLLSPIPLLQWQVAVANEPSEGDGSIDHGSVPCGLSAQSDDLALQLFPGLKLRHFWLQSKNHLSDDGFGFI